jgi:oxaloacetate decarboxylase gamma subunit
MTEMQLIGESLRLMAIGMGIVFTFLVTLVVLLRAMSFVALRIGPAEPEPAAAPPATVPVSGFDDDIVAVISAAIARWRAGHRPPR